MNIRPEKNGQHQQILNKKIQRSLDEYDAYLNNLDLLASLSSREKEVLKLIATGLKSQEIAEHLCLSKYTIDDHRRNLFRKLKAKNMVTALYWARVFELI